MAMPLEIGDLRYEALPSEIQYQNEAYFIGRNVNLRRLALLAEITVSTSNDGTSITWPDDETSLRLAPTPEGKPGIWISGNSFISGYEGEGEDARSKLLGEEGDLIIAGRKQILVISESGTNPKHMRIPGTDTLIPSTNASVIDANGHLSPMSLPERIIKDIFEEARTGVTPYPDY